jgi:hypothetical protein
VASLVLLAASLIVVVGIRAKRVRPAAARSASPLPAGSSLIYARSTADSLGGHQ